MFLEAREACGEVQVEAAVGYGMLYMVDVIWDSSSCTTQSIVPTRILKAVKIPTVATSHVRLCRYHA